MEKVILVLVASILSAILYRLGGSAKNGDWWDWMKHSKTRDWGCTIVALVTLGLLGKTMAWYYYIPTFIMCWAALTTYWDDLFNRDCYIMHLAMVGLAFLLFVFFGEVSVWMWALRVCVMGFFGFGSHIIDELSIPHKDVVSENLRGLAIVITLPLLLLGGV